MPMETFFPYQLAIAAAAMSRDLESVYRQEGGLSREEWRVLFLLADCAGMTSKELAQRSSLDKVQISRAAHRLENKGLILGEASSQDRRLRDYACTAAGRDYFFKLFPKVEVRAQAVLDRMGAEKEAALRNGVEALIAATKAEV